MTNEQLDNGVAIFFVANGKIHCFGIPQVLDIASAPKEWTPVPQAAIDYRWPEMTGNAADTCRSVPVLRTIANASWGYSYLYTVTISGGVIRINPVEIPENTPCGDKLSPTTYNIYALHAVTYNGVSGMAVCK